MTTEENILWKKLSDFKLDDGSSSFKFSSRLARENGWTISYSKKVIEEYKKFIFLCCITKTGVTPSDQVDQAWHLHLTYTQSYWTELCKNTLAKEIHHNPTKGGESEGKKFDDFYTSTITLYKDTFNIDPPKEIWPDNEKRFSDINFQRVNLKNYWLFRKPDLSRKNPLLIIVLVVSLLSIQASTSDILRLTSLGLLLGFVIYFTLIKNKNGRGGGGSGDMGCSTAGCNGDSGHHGHSGCGSDSGCGGGSGCSGCGGD